MFRDVVLEEMQDEEHQELLAQGEFDDIIDIMSESEESIFDRDIHLE